MCADNLPVNAVLAHQPSGTACAGKGFGIGKVIPNAALQTVVVNAGISHHFFECLVNVCADCHQLLHVTLKGGVVALGQKFQASQPLVQVNLRPDQQRRAAAKQSFQRLERCATIGPREAGAVGLLPFKYPPYPRRQVSRPVAVDVRLFATSALVWLPAFAGMTGVSV